MHLITALIIAKHLVAAGGCRDPAQALGYAPHMRVHRELQQARGSALGSLDFTTYLLNMSICFLLLSLASAVQVVKRGQPNASGLVMQARVLRMQHDIADGMG